MPASDPAGGNAGPRRVSAGGWRAFGEAFGLVLLHAGLLAASLPPTRAWPLAFVAPIPLLALALRRRDAAGGRRGAFAAHAGVFAAGVPAWMFLHHWMTDVTVPGWIGLACYMTAWWSLFVAVAARLARRWPSALVLPVAGVGLEVLRAELAFDGYPWFLAGQALVEQPVFVQGAALLGWIWPSLLATTVAGGLAGAVAGGPRTRTASAGVVVLALLAAAIPGALSMRAADRAARPGPRILVVQTNLPQSNKIGWSFEDQRRDAGAWALRTVDAILEARSAGAAPDLFCWPETMLPGPGLEPGTLDRLEAAGLGARTEFARLARDLVRRAEVPGLYGSIAIDGLDFGPDGRAIWDRQTNAAYLVRPDGTASRADKVFLTPFGETMPYISLWPWLERRLLAFGAGGMSFDLDAGDRPAVLELDLAAGERVRLGVPICFEVTMSRVCRRIAYGPRPDGAWGKRADVLVNLTNDGWFGDFDPGREQHFQLARLRAIENRVPVVRVANTGLSGWIDASGNVRAVLGEGRYGEGRREGALSVAIELDDRIAPAARIAPVATWLPPLALALLLAGSPGPRRGTGGA